MTKFISSPGVGDCYLQTLLGREPDVAGLETYSDALRNGQDVSWLL